MEEIPVEELVKKGTMVKSPFKMTPAERAEWIVRCQAETREYLFSIGQPLVYKRDGQMIAEYANGKIEVLD
jgi:hypothetical protein